MRPRIRYGTRRYLRRRVFQKLIIDSKRIAAGNCNGGYNPELYFRFEFGKMGPSGKWLSWPRGKVIFDKWPRWAGRPRDVVPDKRYRIRRKDVVR